LLGRVPEDLSQVRARLPDTVTLGIAGDWRAASALQAGFDVWYSVVGGLFPQTALAIARSKVGTIRAAGAALGAVPPLW
jgi:4-hydroxy-tetrahydrodipicolinate synthase